MMSLNFLPIKLSAYPMLGSNGLMTQHSQHTSAYDAEKLAPNALKLLRSAEPLATLKNGAILALSTVNEASFISKQPC